MGEGRPRAPRPRLPEARDGAVDQVGLDGDERFVVDAEPRGYARGEVLDGHVGLPGEVPHDGARLGAPVIEPNALLAHVDAGEVRALIVTCGIELQMALAHVIAAARALDLDDASAQIGKEARAVRAGEDAREVEDDQVAERSRG